MQSTGNLPETANFDLGYRGVNKDNLDIDIKYRGKCKGLTEQEKRSSRSSVT